MGGSRREILDHAIPARRFAPVTAHSESAWRARRPEDDLRVSGWLANGAAELLPIFADIAPQEAGVTTA